MVSKLIVYVLLINTALGLGSSCLGMNPTDDNQERGSRSCHACPPVDEVNEILRKNPLKPAAPMHDALTAFSLEYAAEQRSVRDVRGVITFPVMMVYFTNEEDSTTFPQQISVSMSGLKVREGGEVEYVIDSIHEAQVRAQFPKAGAVNIYPVVFQPHSSDPSGGALFQ